MSTCYNGRWIVTQCCQHYPGATVLQRPVGENTGIHRDDDDDRVRVVRVCCEISAVHSCPVVSLWLAAQKAGFVWERLARLGPKHHQQPSDADVGSASCQRIVFQHWCMTCFGPCVTTIDDRHLDLSANPNLKLHRQRGVFSVANLKYALDLHSISSDCMFPLSEFLSTIWYLGVYSCQTPRTTTRSRWSYCRNQRLQKS
jgi:hypothetical protein